MVPANSTGLNIAFVDPATGIVGPPVPFVTQADMMQMMAANSMQLAAAIVNFNVFNMNL